MISAPGAAMIQPYLRLAICVICRDVGHLCANGATIFNRRPDQARIIESKTLRLPEIGYEFPIPQLPGVKGTVASVTLNDQTRGVVDHYVLISQGDLTAPVAAIVVTKLPAYLRSRGNAFATVRDVETGLATTAGVTPIWEEIAGPYGDALEMLVPDRVGSPCYPTSTFMINRPGPALHTLGISRFALINDDLVEFSLILEVQGMSAAEAEAYGRRIMDGFWLGIKPIGKAGLPTGNAEDAPVRSLLGTGTASLQPAPRRSSTYEGGFAGAR